MAAGGMANAPFPPIADWEMNPPEMFPTFPRMKQDAVKYGTGVHTYVFMNTKRITILTDSTHYEAIYSPGEYAQSGMGKCLRMDMDRVAHQYFNIHRDVCPYTRGGLDGLRIKALNPKTCGEPRGLNDIVGAGIQECMDKLPESGEIDLLQVAEFTFPGVNDAIFGKGVVPADAEGFFYDYDECVARSTLGLPKDEAYMKAYKKVEDMFLAALEKGVHKSAVAGRGMIGRLSPLPEDTDLRKQASFLCSIFWAPQANTLPMTYWTLAHILSNPDWTARARAEADASGMGVDGRFLVDTEDDRCLPFIRGCMSEVLRMYIANMTLRKVDKDMVIETKGGKFTIPQGDSFMLSSYVTHYDEKVFPDPFTYNPDRWLDSKGEFNEKALPKDYFVPFGKGRYSCSGRHLLHLELPTLVVLFLREFDCKMIDPLPEPDWSYVVASVRPRGWPHNFQSRVKFSRRRASRL